MPATATPNTRVIVRLPWNRPEQPLPDPPRIEWTPEKADILWKVIERSRSTDNGGTDWKGLAAHLEVPLPYLLYRVHSRFQEELRGLQDIPGVSSPAVAQYPSKPFDDLPLTEKPTFASRAASRLNVSGRMSPAGRLSTPMGVRARLSSLGSNSPRPGPKKATSSSTLNAHGPKKDKPRRPLSPTSSASSDSTDSEDEETRQEEEADRNAEEQEALDRKLRDLQKLVTNEALGLVSAASPAGALNKGKGKEVYRGRPVPSSASPMQRSFHRDRRSSPLSLSSSSSARGSIPDIPSPPPDSQPHSPISRHLSPNKSVSPPALSPRSALGQRYGPLVERAVSEQGSSHGSEASSFDDISDASLSASALESALLSNLGKNGSRFSSTFGRSRVVR